VDTILKGTMLAAIMVWLVVAVFALADITDAIRELPHCECEENK